MLRLVFASALLLLSGCTSFLGNGRDPLAADSVKPFVAAESPAVRSEAAAKPQDADGKYGPEVGESILQFAGSISSQSADPGPTTDTLSLLAGIGWFQSEWLEIGGQVVGNWFLTSGADVANVFIAPYANYNHRVNNRFWLYGGPHLGLGYFKIPGDSATDVEWGLHGGARYWLEPRTSAFAELRYTAASVELAGTDIDFDTIQLLLGFSVVF
jgi:hypothetical protein